MRLLQILLCFSLVVSFYYVECKGGGGRGGGGSRSGGGSRRGGGGGGRGGGGGGITGWFKNLFGGSSSSSTSLHSSSHQPSSSSLNNNGQGTGTSVNNYDINNYYKKPLSVDNNNNYDSLHNTGGKMNFDGLKTNDYGVNLWKPNTNTNNNNNNNGKIGFEHFMPDKNNKDDGLSMPPDYHKLLNDFYSKNNNQRQTFHKNYDVPNLNNNYYRNDLSKSSVTQSNNNNNNQKIPWLFYTYPRPYYYYPSVYRYHNQNNNNYQTNTNNIYDPCEYYGGFNNNPIINNNNPVTVYGNMPDDCKNKKNMNPIKNNGTKLALGLLSGAATGISIGYLLGTGLNSFGSTPWNPNNDAYNLWLKEKTDKLITDKPSILNNMTRDTIIESVINKTNLCPGEAKILDSSSLYTLVPCNSTDIKINDIDITEPTIDECKSLNIKIIQFDSNINETSKLLITLIQNNETGIDNREDISFKIIKSVSVIRKTETSSKDKYYMHTIKINSYSNMNETISYFNKINMTITQFNMTMNNTSCYDKTSNDDCKSKNITNTFLNLSILPKYPTNIIMSQCLIINKDCNSSSAVCENSTDYTKQIIETNTTLTEDNFANINILMNHNIVTEKYINDYDINDNKNETNDLKNFSEEVTTDYNPPQSDPVTENYKVSYDLMIDSLKKVDSIQSDHYKELKDVFENAGVEYQYDNTARKLIESLENAKQHKSME